MHLSNTLVLVTVNPTNPLASHAYRYVKSLLELSKLTDVNSEEGSENKSPEINIFFYGESANTANALRWQVADRENITEKWMKLSADYDLALPVCVSTAITRGVTDADNSKRHKLEGHNLADGFKLVGLGELAEMISKSDKVIQF